PPARELEEALRRAVHTLSGPQETPRETPPAPPVQSPPPVPTPTSPEAPTEGATPTPPVDSGMDSGTTP
ncbi:IF-2 protein, partial [Corallococcus sp. AB038B]